MPGRWWIRYYVRLLREGAYSIARAIALPLVRRDAVRSGSHSAAYPLATYSPWLVDPEFHDVYQAVREHTLVDVWRCWELWSLLGELRDIPGALVEVGVWRGGTGALMAARARSLGLTAPCYLCDTWSGVVKAGAADNYYEGGEHSDSSARVVRDLIDRLGLSDVELLEGVFPEETGGRIAAEELRLCHIDVDVAQSAADVFDWAWPRLSPGGVVVFDDYGFPATPGVTRFVDSQRAHPDRLVIHNLNGHALVVKR